MPDFKLFTLRGGGADAAAGPSDRAGPHGGVPGLARGGRPVRDPDRRRARRLGRDAGADRGARDGQPRTPSGSTGTSRSSRRSAACSRGSRPDWWTSIRCGRTGPIFLCWRLGEERITHWHEIESGFSGRQPIDGAILSAHLLVIRFWLFLHLLGFTMWLGGRARRDGGGHRGQARGARRLWAPSPGRRPRSHKAIIAPGRAAGGALRPDPHLLGRRADRRAGRVQRLAGGDAGRGAPGRAARAADRPADGGQAGAARSDWARARRTSTSCGSARGSSASVSGMLALVALVAGAMVRTVGPSHGLNANGPPGPPRRDWSARSAAIFRRRVHPFNCFSRSIASRASPAASTWTSRARRRAGRPVR